jgi:lysophospholipase L1-like esterase
MRVALLLLLTSCGIVDVDASRATEQAACGDPPPPTLCGAPPGSPVLWVDGTEPALPLPADGAAVTVIANKGSLGGTFSAASGAAPLFRAACIGTAKRGCLRFDGVNDVMVSSLPASSWTFLHSAAYTCSALVRFPVYSSEKTHVVMATAGTATSQRGFTFANDDAVSAEERLRVEQKNGGSTTNNRIAQNGFFTPQLWNRLAVTFDPTLPSNKITGYLNGSSLAVSGAETATPSTLAPSNTLALGAFGNVTAGFLDGDLVDVVCYASTLDPAELAALDEWQACEESATPYGPQPGFTMPTSSALCDPLDDPCLVGVMGDSLTSAMTPASWANGYLRSTYPRSHVFRNVAVGGTTIETARTAQWTNVLKPLKPHVVMMLIGTNDIGKNLTPAADILADIDEVADDAIALGSKVVTVSLLPRCSNYGGACSTMQPIQDAVNAGLASRANGMTRFYVDAYATMGEPATPNNLRAVYDSGDGLHPNQTGHDALGAFVDTVVFP